MKPQDGVALIIIELVRFGILHISIQLDRVALMPERPVLEAGKEKFPDAFGAEVGVDNDVVDLQLFSRIEADRYPAIGHGDQFAVLPETEAMIGGVVEHVGQVTAYLFGVCVGMQFIGERDDGIAVLERQFPKFQRVVVFDGLVVGHGLRFSRLGARSGGMIKNTKLVDIFH